MATLTVAITKAKSTIDIDTDTIPEDVYREALLQGLKVLLNRGASKITKETYPNAEELKAAALAKAEEQVELVKTSKIKFSGVKAKKASGAIMTEARRIAKARVKDAMKEAGIKISHVEASEITKAANALLDADPSIVEEATAALAERAAKPIKIDVKALIHENPKLVEKAAAKKAKDKAGTISAKQAGKVKHRPTAEQPTAH